MEIEVSVKKGKIISFYSQRQIRHWL